MIRETSLGALERRTLFALRDFEHRVVPVDELARLAARRRNAGDEEPDPAAFGAVEFAVELLHLRDLATPGPERDGRPTWMLTTIGESLAASLEAVRWRVAIRVGRAEWNDHGAHYAPLQAAVDELDVETAEPGEYVTLTMTVYAASDAEAGAIAVNAVAALGLTMYDVETTAAAGATA